MSDEVEAHDLVKRHLERTIRDSSVVVLARNNSKDRLTASTRVPDESPLALTLADARAATDALTGLANKRACHDTLKRMVAHAGRAVSPLSAVMLDLDHFKQVNDRYGHGVGDDVLAATGGVLEAVLHGSDFAGRYGGEELLVLLPDTDAQGALALAEKLRTAIAAIDAVGVDHEVTASFGVASYPTDAVDGDGLVRMADRALFAAKRAGRNRVELAGADDGSEPGQAPVLSPDSPSVLDAERSRAPAPRAPI